MKACRCRWGHSSGFTLVEIMIVVAIIGMLAMIAVPSFIAARKRALVTATVSDLRVFEEAFHQYNLENGAYPLPSYQPPFMIFQPGELPPPMEGYLKERHWNATTPCGGQYYWHGGKMSYYWGGWVGDRYYIQIINGSPELLAQVGKEIDGVEGGKGSSGKVMCVNDDMYFFIDKITWDWPGVKY